MDMNENHLEQIREILKSYWRKYGDPHLIAAKHSEFVVEPTIFVGDKLNPEILKILVANYLLNTSNQDSGTGQNIEVTPDKLVIKTPKGKPLVVVRDKKIIQQYLASRA